MGKVLSYIYSLSGAAAASLIALIAVLTLAQMVARLFGAIVPSADDLATFAMAAAIFLGMAYTYRKGGHVRVLAVINHLPSGLRRKCELTLLTGTSALLAWLLCYTADMIHSSYQLNEYTVGLFPIPIWIPMSSMLIGVLVFMVAVLDDLIAVLQGRSPSYGNEEVTSSAE